jgi:hypothetical protein
VWTVRYEAKESERERDSPMFLTTYSWRPISIHSHKHSYFRICFLAYFAVVALSCAVEMPNLPWIVTLVVFPIVWFVWPVEVEIHAFVVDIVLPNVWNSWFICDSRAFTKHSRAVVTTKTRTSPMETTRVHRVMPPWRQ